MSDETAPQPRIKTTWLVGVAAAFAIFVVIGAYSSRMTWEYPDYDQQRAEQRMETLATVQKAENALLYPAVDAQGNAHAEWIDPAKGIVRIPIDDAMAREIDTLKAQPVQVGAVIPGTTPPPPATPAVATPAAAMPPATAATNGAPATPGAKKAHAKHKK
ncbi:MAG: hypothetical protein LV480_05200 [Methylacidiphilales bacterium]|nr:hypothetical protein [Candidatus Methylacidiphilales bacterium]